MNPDRPVQHARVLHVEPCVSVARDSYACSVGFLVRQLWVAVRRLSPVTEPSPAEYAGRREQDRDGWREAQ